MERIELAWGQSDETGGHGPVLLERLLCSVHAMLDGMRFACQASSSRDLTQGKRGSYAGNEMKPLILIALAPVALFQGGTPPEEICPASVTTPSGPNGSGPYANYLVIYDWSPGGDPESGSCTPPEGTPCEYQGFVIWAVPYYFGSNPVRVEYTETGETGWYLGSHPLNSNLALYRFDWELEAPCGDDDTMTFEIQDWLPAANDWYFRGKKDLKLTCDECSGSGE